MGRRRDAKSAASAPSDATSGAVAHAFTSSGRHFRHRKGAPLWLKITAAAAAIVVVAGIALGGYLILRLQGNVSTSDLNAAVGQQTSSSANDSHDPLQILILGTDTRAGANSEYGTAADSSGNGNSDVMMLLNISANDKNVSLISFPRDLMTPIPACKDKNGQVHPAIAQAQLNSALLEAGPGCTVAAINQLTGLTIDHFMVADFTAVKDLSNVIGGVQVCVDHRVNDFNGSGLVLPAGTSSVQGEQALAFLRTRHSFGDASDLARIKAQQYFLGSMVRKIKSDNTLSNLPEVYSIADAITKNLTVDKGLSNIGSMVTIANRLKNVDTAKVAFVTVPNAPDPADPNRVVLSQPNANKLFQAIANNADLTATTPSASASASGSATATASAAPSVPAYNKSFQPVSVLNASGVAGKDTELVNKLAAAGFTNSAAQGSAAAPVAATTINYGSNFADVAADVRTLLNVPNATLVLDPTLNGVQVVAGTDLAAGSSSANPSLPPDIVASTANQSNECLTVNPQQYPELYGK